MLLTAGQAGDNPQLWPLLEHHLATSKSKFRLLADKAYFHNSTRAKLRTMKIAHTIPEKSDQIAYRKAEGLRLVVDHPRSTPCSTANATPSSEASTGSSSGAASPPGMTSIP